MAASIYSAAAVKAPNSTVPASDLKEKRKLTFPTAQNLVTEKADETHFLSSFKKKYYTYYHTREAFAVCPTQPYNLHIAIYPKTYS